MAAEESAVLLPSDGNRRKQDAPHIRLMARFSLVTHQIVMEL